MNSNILGRLFNWLGDALEQFNPSAFRFLAAVLPYLTPIPVAWLTASSATSFLKFSPVVSVIFVFGLEGIGLWFTSLLVDAVVEWIRSKNWKSSAPMIMFGIVVAIYVYILVNLNVTLEQATGNTNASLSKVITLLCFLPLITGIGNGYYKLKLDYKTQTELAKRHMEEREDKIRNEQREERMTKWKLKHGFESSSGTNGTSISTSRSSSRTSISSKSTSGSTNGSSRMGRPSIHEQRVFSYMDDMISRTGQVPTFTDVMRDLKLPQSTASRLHNKYRMSKN